MEHRELTLQPRLRMLADLVPPGAVVADVGTDHGYLPVWLLQHGKIPRAIASDINAKPLEHARRTAAECGMSNRMEFRLCAGLDGFCPGEADVIVIAGMGGETIAAILEAAPWTASGNTALLLQPMTKAEYLRIWLTDKGYSFTGEHLAFDKDFLYPIFIVTGGNTVKLTDEEAYAGVLLEGDPLYGMYLSQQMSRLRTRIDGLTRSGNESAVEEIRRLETLYGALAARKEKLHDHSS